MLFVVLSACLAVALGALNAPFVVRSLAEVDHIVSCNYVQAAGVFDGEGLWQSGNTIESISNAMIYLNSTKWVDLLNNTYRHTPVIVDNCFDDHQWWLLGWLRAYHATGIVEYVQRAAAVFDFIVEKAWSTQCGGGVIWCPTMEATTARLKQSGMNISLAGLYKNAITNELFLSSAMGLHPYTALLGRPAGYYLDWAKREWAWLEGSGMINAQNLINDGLSDQCQNNGQTTWTYNQGVLLSGLQALAVATGNQSLIDRADMTVVAVTQHLTANGILVEPCNGQCDSDQHLFKGIFMRHLGYLTQNNVASAQKFNDFIMQNAASLVDTDGCSNGGFGLDWRGPCSSQTTASASSALDLLLAAAQISAPAPKWKALGGGNCVDDRRYSMPNCFNTNIDEKTCRAAAEADPGAVAYDLQTPCSGNSFCRVRTLSGASSCLQGWRWTGGPATTVTTTSGSSNTICVVKST